MEKKKRKIKINGPFLKVCFCFCFCFFLFLFLFLFLIMFFFCFLQRATNLILDAIQLLLGDRVLQESGALAPRGQRRRDGRPELLHSLL
jgi:hypothetical protein